MPSRVGEVTAVVVETARESELEVEPENGIEWLQSRDKFGRMRSYFLWMRRESGFLTWKLPLVKML